MKQLTIDNGQLTMEKMDNKGETVLILILVMTVALAIGLSVVQKSLVDVSTASKVEQSSRAFSAAEAGVEKALAESTTTTHVTPTFSDNSSQVTAIVDSGLMPTVPATGDQQVVLEFPPLTKEGVAQVWLADFNSTTNPPAAFYTQNSLDVYWGNSSQDQAAIELTLVYYDGSIYKPNKWYLDQINRGNGFEVVTCNGNNLVGVNTYQCKKTLDFSSIKIANPSATWMLLRARLLYNTTSQPIAVQAVGTCGQPCSLPPQARSITSTGASGETQRRVQVFQQSKTIPFFFDYAIFSTGIISK